MAQKRSVPSRRPLAGSQLGGARRRKMTEDDRKILAQVFKDFGCRWVYKALAARYCDPPEAVCRWTARVRWTDKKLAAWRFLSEITAVYTFTAVYVAAESIKFPPWRRFDLRPVQQPA
jgi:hypothetical protein